MGAIFVVIVLFVIVVVGFDNMLIALAVGGVVGLIAGIVQGITQKKGIKQNNHKQHNSPKEKGQSYWDDEDQIVNDMIIMEMMEEEEKQRQSQKDNKHW